MKLIKVMLMILLVVFAFIVMACSASADEIRLVFENEDFETVYSSDGETARAVLYLGSEFNGEVTFFQAVYNDDTLKSISYETAYMSGGGVLRADTVRLDKDDTIRAFVFGDDLKPLAKSMCPENVTGIVDKAEFKVGDSVYDAYINHAERVISVNIPYYISSGYGVDTVQGIISSVKNSMENATVRIDGKWKAILPAAEYDINLLESNSITLTGYDGKIAEYKIVASLTRYNRVYDCEDAIIETEATASSWNKAYRIGAPKYISSESGTGDGTWLLEKGSALATSILSENGNDYINISKAENEKYTLWTSGSASSSNMFSSEFRFRVNSATPNADILSVWSSNTDKIVLTSQNMNEGAYTLAHTANDGSDKEFSDSVSLSFGKWYTMRFVFKKGNEVKSGSDYIIEVYINGALVDAFCHVMSSEDFANAGSFISVSQPADPAGSSNTLPKASFPYIAFCVADESSVNIDIDDIKTDHKPTDADTLINYATVSVGGKTYSADVNTLRKEIVADISDSLTIEQLKNAKVTINTRATVSPKANGTQAVDLTSPVTYTLTATDGKYKEKYTLRIELSKLMRNYDSEGATINASGVPERLSSEKGLPGNWIVNKKTNTSASAVNASISISNYNNNDYITVYKKDTVNGLYFMSLLDKTAIDTSVSPNGIFADKFAMEVKFSIGGVDADDPDYFGSISASREDRIILSKKNAPDGKYYLAASNVNGTGVYDLTESPELSFNTWHTLRYVFRRYAPVEYTNADWYRVEIYLDGKFVTEIHRHDPTIQENAWQYMYSGRFTNAENYAQIFVSMFTGFTGTFRLDDFNLTYMENWNGAGNSVVYESDYPVAVITDTDGKKAECRLTLDSVNNKANVYVPYTTSVEEQRNMEGRGAPQPYADVSNTVLVFPEEYNIKLNGKAYGNIVPCDFNKNNILSVNGIEYIPECVPTELSVRYDTEGTTVSSGTLSALSGGSESHGNYGYSVMKVSDSSAVGIATDEKYKSVISLANKNANSDVIFTAVQPFENKAAVSNSTIVSSFKICVEDVDLLNEFAKVAPFGSEGFSLQKVSDNEFTIGESGKRFAIGKWYNIDVVFKKSTDGCKMDIYADSMYIESQNITANDGDLNNIYQMNFALLSDNTSTVRIDELEIQAVNDVLKDKTVIHLMGDSICTYYGGTTTLRGWGQYLMNEFDDRCITLNHSIGGYNTNIFLKGSDVEKTKTRERWSSIKARMKDGDYLIIALAWNEANATNGTTKDQYEENIMKMVSEARLLGVVPVIVTPHLWVKDTTPHELENARYDYVECIRNICAKNNIACLDLNSELEKEWAGIDVDNLYSTYFYSDGLHMNSNGAKLFSDKIVSQIKSTGFSLKDYLK